MASAEQVDERRHVHARLRHDEVFVAQQAEQLPVGVDDRHRAVAVRGEHVGRLRDRLVGPERHDVGWS